MGEAAVEALDHAGLVRPFLARRFRSRYDDLQPGSARRSELLNKLCHRYTEILDWRYAGPTLASSLASALRGLGGGNRVYCLCIPPELDGREVPLAEAVAALSGHGLPVLLVCKPGSLAYFEPEYESGTALQFWLQRNAEPVAAADQGRA